MPLRAGGNGEKKATRISTNDFQSQSSRGLRNLDDQGSARGVAGEVNLHGELRFGASHGEDHLIGGLLLFAQRDDLRARIVLLDRIGRTEIYRLGRGHSSLPQFLAGEVKESDGVAAAGAGS